MNRDELCVRAREWASLRLDNELSEFEGAMLDAHVSGCVACRDYVARVEHVVEQVRDAALVPFEQSVLLPRSRGWLWTMPRTAAAAAALVAAVGLASGLILKTPGLKLGPSPAAGATPTVGDPNARDFKLLRAAQMRPAAQVVTLKSRGLFR